MSAICQIDQDRIPLPEWMGRGSAPRELEWPGSLICAAGAWTEIRAELSLRSVWMAKITGKHPVFDMRREFVGLRGVEAGADGRIVASFRPIEDGLYEFRNFGSRRAADKIASGYFILDRSLGISILDRDTAYQIAEMYASARDAVKALAAAA